MLRAKQRKIASKILPPRPKRTSSASASSKSLKKVSRTKWMIFCAIIIFMTSLYVISNSLSSAETESPPSDVNLGLKDINKLNPRDEYMPGIESIYVSVATLGDHACPMTINDMFKKAKYPHNIKVGIYQQNEGSDPDCLSMLSLCTHNSNQPIMHPDLGDITLLCSFKNNIIINRTTIKDGAKGPVYGRHMSMELVPKFKIKFDFICMIDSHTLFRQDWDEYTMQMWYSIEPDHKHAVITHYPWGAEHLKERVEKSNEHSYHICGSIYEGGPNFMVRNANGCFAKNARKPVRVPFFAGGFSFAPARFWEIVPLDRYLLYIFSGEEFDIATRGWTHGYDFYSPNHDIVGHYYDKGPKRRSPHVGSNKESHHLRDLSEKRLNYMWGLWEIRYPKDKDLRIEEIAKKCELRELAQYGLGRRRTLQQYWKWAGIDPINKNITVFKEEYYAQGGLPYVPY